MATGKYYVCCKAVYYIERMTSTTTSTSPFFFFTIFQISLVHVLVYSFADEEHWRIQTRPAAAKDRRAGFSEDFRDGGIF